MNNTRAAEVNTHAASPESIGTPPKPVGSATFEAIYQECFQSPKGS
jgi:hypothetical protein